MSNIEDAVKNVEIAIKELRAALMAEEVISSPELMANQEAELSTEELLAMSSIRL